VLDAMSAHGEGGVYALFIRAGSLFTERLRSNPYICSMKGDRAMKDLIKGAMIGAVIATVVTGSVSALTSLGGEPEHSIVRALRADRAAAENPRCAPKPIKMPCLQPNVSQSRAAS
jgi:hypothetical protein